MEGESPSLSRAGSPFPPLCRGGVGKNKINCSTYPIRWQSRCPGDADSLLSSMLSREPRDVLPSTLCLLLPLFSCFLLRSTATLFLSLLFSALCFPIARLSPAGTAVATFRGVRRGQGTTKATSRCNQVLPLIVPFSQTSVPLPVFQPSLFLAAAVVSLRSPRFFDPLLLFIRCPFSASPHNTRTMGRY